MNNDFILLLGAGASFDAGLPMAFGMTDLFKESVLEQGDKDLTGALSLVLGGIHFLRGLRGVYPEVSINIEEVAATLDALRTRHTHQLSPFVGSWNETVRRYGAVGESGRDCLGEVNNLLREKINEWLTTPEIGKIRYFQALQDFVREFDNIDIFTLNYDLCVETAIDQCGVKFTCGFTSHGWDTNEFRRGDVQVRLYKQHGSLDWYRDDEDQMIYSARIPPEDRVPAAGYTSLLIFGTNNKLEALDPFLYLSHIFSESVKTTKVLVVIGYGFGDEYINKIIRQGFARDSRKRMVVVGANKQRSEEEFRTKFNEAAVLVDAGRVTFMDGGTKAVLNDGTLLTEIKNALDVASEEGPFNDEDVF